MVSHSWSPGKPHKEPFFIVYDIINLDIRIDLVRYLFKDVKLKSTNPLIFFSNTGKCFLRCCQKSRFAPSGCFWSSSSPFSSSSNGVRTSHHHRVGAGLLSATCCPSAERPTWSLRSGGSSMATCTLFEWGWKTWWFWTATGPSKRRLWTTRTLSLAGQACMCWIWFLGLEKVRTFFSSNFACHYVWFWNDDILIVNDFTSLYVTFGVTVALFLTWRL